MTRDKIIELGVRRLFRLIDEHGIPNSFMPDEMTNGVTSLRLGFGRYGDAIADAVTSQRRDVRVDYLRGCRAHDGERIRWSSSYFQVQPKND